MCLDRFSNIILYCMYIDELIVYKSYNFNQKLMIDSFCDYQLGCFIKTYKCVNLKE